MSAKTILAELRRLMDESKATRGFSGIQNSQVVAMATDEPDAIVEVVETLLRGAVALPETKRFAFQLALALAAAYQVATGDDSLQQTTMLELERQGLQDVKPGTYLDPDVVEPPKMPALVALQVDRDAWSASDPYSLIRKLTEFADGEDRAIQLRTVCGRLLIQFDGLNADPREVWEVPEIRAYMADLLRKVPGLAFYLCFDEQYGMFRVLYLCLADPDALEGLTLNLTHVSTVAAVMAILLGMKSLCKEAGVSWDEQASRVMAQFPQDYTQDILTSVGDAHERR